MKDKTAITDIVRISKGRGRPLASALTMTGKVRLELRGPDGNIKEVRETNNLVVNTGEIYVRNIWLAHEGGPAAPTAMASMKLGTNNTAPAEGDTLLNTYLVDSVRSGASFSVAAGATSRMDYTCDWAAGVGTTLNGIQEVGIFNDTANANSGTMLARAIISPLIDKGDSDTVTVTWQITVD